MTNAIKAEKTREGGNLMKIFHLKTRLGFRLGSLLSALLVVICTIFTSGCFKGSADLTIREDGTSTLKTTILGADLVSSAVAEAKDEVMKSNPSATVKDVQEDDKKGFEIIAEYPNMRTLAEKGGKIFARVPGKGEGIQEKKTWFYDMYAFDLYVGAKEENSGDDSDPQMQAILKGFLDQIKYDFYMHLPVVPDKNNADSVQDGGKTLHWNLSATLTENANKHISVEYRVWNKLHIALSAALGGIFVVLAVVFFVLLKKTEGKAGAKKLAAFACILLAAAVIAVSAWQATQTVVFTTQDSLSPVAQEPAE